MTCRRFRATIEDMRNIYNCYLLCRNIDRHMEVHSCENLKCRARGEAGTSMLAKHKKLSKKLFKDPKNTSEFLTEFNRWMRYESFAESKGYINVFYCEGGGITFATITDKGIELTDNVFLPFTPVGLWKEIWKEHKVFFTIIPTLVTFVTGFSIRNLFL